MQLGQPFDARQVDPAAFAAPPILGDYHVRIVESEAKPTADNSGGYLQLDLEILDPGPYLNTKIPYRLNLYNKSQQTVEIAYRQLSAVCYVTGVFNVTDTRQLHGIPFIAIIGPQKDNPQYANVFGVKDINGNLPGKTPGAAGVTAAPLPPVNQPAWAPPGAAAAPAQPAWQPPGAPTPPVASAPPPTWTPPGAPPAAAPPTWQPGAAAAPSKPPWAT